MEQQEALQDLKDLLSDAYRFDDKPHRLFSTIRAIAVKYTSVDEAAEIERLMDIAYERAHRLLDEDE